MKCAIAQVMDTTGAGDCFTGAYAVAILEGKKPEEALTFAGVSPPLSCMLKPLLGHSGALFWPWSVHTMGLLSASLYVCLTG